MSEAAKVTGEQVTLLEREGLLLAELERWRLALDQERLASKATIERITKLEREMACEEKALAEAATLLVLRKKWHLGEDAEDDTAEKSEK